MDYLIAYMTIHHKHYHLTIPNVHQYIQHLTYTKNYLEDLKMLAHQPFWLEQIDYVKTSTYDYLKSVLQYLGHLRRLYLTCKFTSILVRRA